MRSRCARYGQGLIFAGVVGNGHLRHSGGELLGFGSARCDFRNNPADMVAPENVTNRYVGVIVPLLFGLAAVSVVHGFSDWLNKSLDILIERITSWRSLLDRNAAVLQALLAKEHVLNEPNWGTVIADVSSLLANEDELVLATLLACFAHGLPPMQV